MDRLKTTNGPLVQMTDEGDSADSNGWIKSDSGRHWTGLVVQIVFFLPRMTAGSAVPFHR